MSEIRQTKTLFDKTSIHATDYSLVLFSFRDQVTIQAVGLHPEDVITFEVVHLESGTPDEMCGCFVKPGAMPRIAAVEKLMCFECGGAGEESQPVRLTAANPIVVLNAPQGPLLRAHYEGPGLGTSEVWATIGTETANLLPGMDGCPGECCIDTEWQPTGVMRCIPDSEDVDGNPVAGYVEQQEISNCGNTRWVDAGPLSWQDTGDTRCVDHVEQVKQVNDCGDIRWTDTEQSCGWIATYPLPCGGLAFRPEDDRDPEATVEVDGCGGDPVAYLYPESRPWATKAITGCESCDDSEGVIGFAFEDGRADCDPCQGEPGAWVPTGVRQFDGNYGADQYKVRRQEINGCGRFDWKDDGVAPWQDTGETRCADGSVERQQSTEFGQTRWVFDREAQWTDTGETRCSTINDTDVEVRQTSECGSARWAVSETLTQVWVDTSLRSCDAGFVYQHEQNQCGRIRVVELRENAWEQTGVERCADNTVEHQEVDNCGNIRWTASAQSCGYLPTYPLPCGGLAFRPGDERDPEATVVLADCEGNPLAYIYPTPRHGASTPVTDCATCEAAELLGYATDGGSADPKCFGKTEATAVTTFETNGQRFILWSNGATTRL